MSEWQLVDLVYRLRQAQKQYLVDRSGESLEKARALAEQVDRMIEAYRNRNQPMLFE